MHGPNSYAPTGFVTVHRFPTAYAAGYFLTPLRAGLVIWQEDDVVSAQSREDQDIAWSGAGRRMKSAGSEVCKSGS